MPQDKLTVTWNITYNCPNTCWYCVCKSLKNTRPPVKKDAMSFLCSLLDLGYSKYSFIFPTGEPALLPYFGDIVNVLCKDVRISAIRIFSAQDNLRFEGHDKIYLTSSLHPSQKVPNIDLLREKFFNHTIILMADHLHKDTCISLYNTYREYPNFKVKRLYSQTASSFRRHFSIFEEKYIQRDEVFKKSDSFLPHDKMVVDNNLHILKHVQY